LRRHGFAVAAALARLRRVDLRGLGFETHTFAAGVGAQTASADRHLARAVDTPYGRQEMMIATGGARPTRMEPPEFEMLASMIEHDARYDMAIEWPISSSGWTMEEEFGFEGRFYKINKGYAMPKPIQKPYPPS
jgi:hypothetical protein